MSRSTLHDQVFLNDGSGSPLPIQTGTWVSKAFNIEEKRRLSVTLGIRGQSGITQGLSGFAATGSFGAPGGFTGQMLVQGTNEISKCYGVPGTPWAGNLPQPGENGYTGARYWNTLASGTINIDNTVSSLLVDFTDVGVSYIRLVFNQSGTGATATGTLGGSGTMDVYLTAKNT